MEKFQRELTEQALKKIVSTLRQVLYRIETKDCKDVFGLLEPYMDSESYQNIRESYTQYQQEKQNNNNYNNSEDIYFDEDTNNIEDEDQEEEDQDHFYSSNDISQKYLLEIQDVAARLVSPSTVSTSNGNSGHGNYTRVADRTREQRMNDQQNNNNNNNNDSGNGNGQRKKKRGASKGFPLNWGLIMSMASNITLDQVQSMINVLIMVLSRTPITVLFKQLHEYKFILTSVFDLLNAILRGDIKDIGTCLIIAVIGVIRFSQRKNLTLITALEVAKYLYNSGNKKKFGLIRSVSLVAFLSNLFKLVNPPPVTPLDVIQLVKSQIQSRL